MPQIPSEIILNDSIVRQTKVLDKLEKWIELSAIAEQEKQSTETPRKYRPYCVNVVAPTVAPILAVQVMPRNQARDSLSLYNAGPGTILFLNQWFDPASILQQFSDPAHPNTFLPAPNQVVEIGYLPVGSSTSIDSTESVWCWNNSTNALLVIVEAVYDRAGSIKSATFPIPGLDGALGAGYTTTADVDGNPTLIKGLR